MTATAEPLHAHEFPAYAVGTRTMRVLEVRPLSERITHFRFVPLDGMPLTAFQPGSHIIVTTGVGRNAYSLVDDGLFPTSYGISVLRKERPAGSDPTAGSGSCWMHDHLVEGAEIEIEGPRSMFAPVSDQRHALLVAGGIGITPVLSHAKAAVRDGITAEIVYSYRPGHAAHLEDLRELARHRQITLYEATTVEDTKALLAERLARQPLGTHAYACGPTPLLDTYTELATASGWPTARVHLERFTAPEQEPGAPFTVTLASSGDTLEVPSGVSLLERLLAHGVPVNNLCRQGVCGECRIPVRSGTITHRDFVLSEEEKQAGESMLCCVSRGDDIEVDL